ncbi:TetR/AcrR family transcriptional regulator C-terminal domain-containing protein [Hoyosella sp. YIM 151337]|uniref:TetR/AcrR family transcriptional regulator n=1 Tax=Hoyosella sp. YIM 151337 TaxID=2992742 RepID=UPI00223570E6|nr:TetR/AcrR family transcriptional regulator C-terminal domain-containing protein [Hoyosella sp. YIM 151337]MCW4354047.1 TetR/AcrR family transcriptional regulator C-terminal domain-containing protein [Hoyosella sp. YIM 151337]
MVQANSGRKRRSRPAAGLPAITSALIVDAACTLTAETGVEDWTLRQLAAVLNAYPAVIYHHVGDREAVVAEVLERVVAQVHVPSDDLAWRAWFAELLTDMRRVLRRYPGVARRLAVHGPTVPSALAIIDQGVSKLRAGGFGDHSVLVYNHLLTQVCLFIAHQDDRDAAAEVRLRSSEVFSSYRDRADLPGLAEMGRLVHEIGQQPDGASRYFDEFFTFTLERALDGVAPLST